ncbi:MAG: ribonuclease III, partial [Coriobacteriales bacterium]|nr:ribonuclease III [Coriobacteriales bacterium]
MSSSVSPSHSSQAAIPGHLLAKVKRLEQILGYQFADRNLALQAITHPSALEDSYFASSYERLKFLGDAYLGSIISELLFNSFPDLDEGGMTRMKIALVAGETLSAKASQLGLRDVIVFGSAERGTGRRGMHSALENVFEALVAALALDGGFIVARQWVIATLSDAISLELADKPDNPKSLLQELLQIEQVTPTYELVSAEGPAHDRRFTAQVLAEGKVLAEGRGHSI